MKTVKQLICELENEILCNEAMHNDMFKENDTLQEEIDKLKNMNHSPFACVMCNGQVDYNPNCSDCNGSGTY